MELTHEACTSPGTASCDDATCGSQETLTAPEWFAAALAAAGTVGLGTSAVDSPAAGAAAAVSAPRVLLLAALLLTMLGAAAAARYRRRQQGRRPVAGAGRAGAYMYGLQAGACFGLSAAACRTGEPRSRGLVASTAETPPVCC